METMIFAFIIILLIINLYEVSALIDIHDKLKKLEHGNKQKN
jgi:hypothetical protein